MAAKATGIDLWREEAVVVRGRKKGALFQITGCERLAVQGSRLTGAVEALGPVVAGLTGRDLILKYTRVPQVPDWQLAKLMDFEVQEIASQAGGELSSDYNLLPTANEMTGEDTVLLALAKNETLDRTMAFVETVRGRVAAYTPNAIALYNAYLTVGPVTEDDVHLLAWIGEQSIDVALVRGASLLFARNVSGGLQVLDSAISQTFNVREERARKIRKELLNLDPGARGSYSSSQEEKVAHSVQGVSGQLVAALRSTIAFCQSQTNIEDLKLARALVCGPGALVRGVDAFLQEALGCPVVRWDAVPDLDPSACPPDQLQTAAEAGPELVVALGLAMAPCFDDLYSIEILPESVKRKRRFFGRTIFNIAAVLLALAYLGWHALAARKRFEQLEMRAAKASARLKTVQHVDATTRKLVEDNEERAARLAKLQELCVPLHSTLRVLRAMDTALPQDLWLTQVRTEEGPVPWRRNPTEREEAADRSPPRGKKSDPRGSYIVVTGRGVPITTNDLIAVFRGFEQALQSRQVALLQPTTSTTRGFSFEFRVDYLAGSDGDGSQ